MTELSPPTQPPRKGTAPRPPRISIDIPPYVASLPTPQIGPATAQTLPGSTAAPPQSHMWPPYANPFNMMYSQKAGEFMSKGFGGFIDFTKSGMSFGEKSVIWLYDRISKWSKKWFTHIFLFLVVLLYSVGGALLFRFLEEKQARQEFFNSHALQKDLFQALREHATADTLQEHPDEWDGQVINILRQHKGAVDSFLNNDKTKEELESFENPWSFWNAMFYCGTIYTTIGIIHQEEFFLIYNSFIYPQGQDDNC